MLTALALSSVPSRFCRTLEGATITRLDERGPDVVVVCVTLVDGGLVELTLRAYVPYQEPSGAQITQALIRHPRATEM